MLRRKTVRKIYVPSPVKEPVPNPLEKFKESLERTNESSQEMFEKQLYTIAAGGIGVTVAFLDKIIPIATSKYTELLYFGWLALTLTILINLISHRVSHRLHYKTIFEIQNDNYDQNKAIRRNRIIGWWNNATITLIMIGIVLILSFITYNLINMSDKTKRTVKTVVQNGGDETKGLQSTVPVTKPKK
jgi:hypothetical protein